MQLKRYAKNPILIPDKSNLWEEKAVSNPGVSYDGKIFHMVYRALSADDKSSIGYAMSEGGIQFTKLAEPLITSEYDWEKNSCEDPRLMYFKNSYYITYVAVSKQKEEPLGFKVRIATATTKDFKKINKVGIIGPNHWSKGGVIFPGEIKGKTAMLLTLTEWVDKPGTRRNPYPVSKIYKAEFENIKQLITTPNYYWDSFLKSLDKFEVSLPKRQQFPESEIGAPPIETKDGWLLVYAGIDEISMTWVIYAALLDLENPQRVVGYSREPLLMPEASYELEGITPNVVFPEGAVVVNDELYVYYGGADKVCCLATCKVEQLLSSLV